MSKRPKDERAELMIGNVICRLRDIQMASEIMRQPLDLDHYIDQLIEANNLYKQTIRETNDQWMRSVDQGNINMMEGILNTITAMPEGSNNE